MPPENKNIYEASPPFPVLIFFFFLLNCYSATHERALEIIMMRMGQRLFGSLEKSSRESLTSTVQETDFWPKQDIVKRVLETVNFMRGKIHFIFLYFSEFVFYNLYFKNIHSTPYFLLNMYFDSFIKFSIHTLR